MLSPLDTKCQLSKKPYISCILSLICTGFYPQISKQDNELPTLTAANVSSMNVYCGLDSYLSYSSNNKRSFCKQHQCERSTSIIYGKITGRTCMNMGKKIKQSFLCTNIPNLTLNKLTI